MGFNKMTVKLKVVVKPAEKCVCKFLFTIRHDDHDIWFDWKCETCGSHLTQFIGVYFNPNQMCRMELKEVIKGVDKT